MASYSSGIAPYPDQYPAAESRLLGSSGITSLIGALANRNTNRVDIPVIGDSVTCGRGATTWANTYVQQLNRAIRLAYPTTVNGSSGGQGFIPVASTDTSQTYTYPFTNTGSLSYLDLGPVRACISMTSAWTATWTAPAGTTSVQVMYFDTSSAGVFSYKVGSGSATNVSNTGTSAELLTASIPITSGQVLTLARVSGWVNVDGILHFAGDETAGVTFHNCGRSGWCAGTQNSIGWNVPEQYALNWAQCYAAGFAGIDAIGIALGINDANTTSGLRTAAQYASDLTALIATIRGSSAALTTIPLMLIGEYQSNEAFTDSGGWAAYAAALRTVAAANSNSFVVDLNYRLPPWAASANAFQYDGLHPNNLGHALIGEIAAAGLRIA